MVLPGRSYKKFYSSVGKASIIIVNSDYSNTPQYQKRNSSFTYEQSQHADIVEKDSFLQFYCVTHVFVRVNYRK